MRAIIIVLLLLVRGATSKECRAASLGWDWSIPSACTSVTTTDHRATLTKIELAQLGKALSSRPKLEHVTLKYQNPLPLAFIDAVVDARAEGSAVTVSTSAQSAEAVESMIAWRTRQVPEAASAIRKEHDEFYTKLKQFGGNKVRLNDDVKIDLDVEPSLGEEVVAALAAAGGCGLVTDRADAGYPGITKESCLLKPDSCWDETVDDTYQCFFYPLPAGSSLVDTLQAEVEAMKDALKKIVEPALDGLQSRALAARGMLLKVADADADGVLSKEEIASCGGSISVDPTNNALEACEATMREIRALEACVDTISLEKSVAGIREGRATALRRFHDEVYPRVCACNAGCNESSSELVFKGWKWEAGWHSYAAGALIDANVHRQTLRAAFWMHILYDSVGVRVAADLGMLEYY